MINTKRHNRFVIAAVLLVGLVSVGFLAGKALEGILSSVQSQVRSNRSKLQGMSNHFQRESYANALETYAALINIFPKSTVLREWRGRIYFGMGKFDKAIADFNEAIKLNPKSANLYWGRALVFHRLKNYSRAIEDWGQAIRLEPRNAVLYENRASTYYWCDKYTDAVADYGKAIKLNPKSLDAYCNRALAFGMLENYNKAIEDWGNAIRLEPRKAILYQDRARAYEDCKQYANAVNDYKRASELDVVNPRYFNLIGDCYQQMGDWDEARTAYLRVMDFPAKTVGDRLQRGYAQHSLGDFERSISEYSEALILQKDAPTPCYWRGRAELAAAKYEQAVKDFLKVLELSPGDAISADALYGRAVSYLCMGESSKGLADLKEYRDLANEESEGKAFSFILDSLAYARLRNEAQERECLSEARKRVKENGRAFRIISYVTGKKSAADLIESAADNREMTDARAYIGLRLALVGDKTEAIGQLVWVRDHGDRTSSEYALALAELNRLQARARAKEMSSK